MSWTIYLFQFFISVSGISILNYSSLHLHYAASGGHLKKIEFVMGHITNPDVDRGQCHANAAGRVCLHSWGLPEAKACEIVDSDAKLYNVDVRLEGGGSEGWPDKPFFPARSTGAIHTSGLRNPVRGGVLQDVSCQACQSSDLVVIWKKWIHMYWHR